MKNNKRQWKTRIDGEELPLLYAVGDADAAEEAAERYCNDVCGDIGSGPIQVDVLGDDGQWHSFDVAIVYEPRFRAVRSAND